MEKKKTFALTRIACAVLAAVILLACSGWAFIYLLGTPAAITEGAELAAGRYVTADAGYIMDICGVEKKTGADEIVAYFAVVPIGDQFVLIRFPADQFGVISALEAQTQGYLYGTLTSLSFHLDVTGMVKELDDSTASLLSDWFTRNGAWMSQSGLIAAVENYGTYLSGYMIDTGSVGAVSNAAAVWMSALAGVLVLYAAGEIVFLCLPKKKTGKKERGTADA